MSVHQFAKLRRDAVPPMKAPKRRKRGQWPARGDWPQPEPLRCIAWGRPDRALAAFVCRSLERTMPAAPWAWHKPRMHLPAALGWFIVAVICAATLIAGRT